MLILKFTQTADLVAANATEEEKIMAMMTQSTKDYDSSQWDIDLFLLAP